MRKRQGNPEQSVKKLTTVGGIQTHDTVCSRQVLDQLRATLYHVRGVSMKSGCAQIYLCCALHVLAYICWYCHEMHGSYT